MNCGPPCEHLADFDWGHIQGCMQRHFYLSTVPTGKNLLMCVWTLQGESGTEDCLWALETLFSVLFSMCRLMVSHSVYACVCVRERKEAVWGKFCFCVCSKPRHNSGMDEVCLCAGMVVNNSWVVCVFIYTTLKMFTCEAHEETVSLTHISTDKLWAMPINYLWFKWRRITFEATSQRHHCVWTFASEKKNASDF